MKTPFSERMRMRAYYAANKEKVRARINAANRYKANVMAYSKITTGCERCGWNESPAGLDYHHLHPSKKKLQVGLTGSFGLVKLVTEAMKCAVLCRNCHQLVEHEGASCERLPTPPLSWQLS